MTLTLRGYKVGPYRELRVRCELAAAMFGSWGLPCPTGRSFHAFGVGAPRTGTHSLAFMLEPTCRSRHEPNAHDTLIHLLCWVERSYSWRNMRVFLRGRDRLLRLEFEAAHYLHVVVPLLVELFPEARFIVTWREPDTWLQSAIDASIATKDYPDWCAWHNYIYGRYEFDFTVDDCGLSRYPSVYPIASYLSYWRDHYEGVVSTIPPDRMLLLNVREIIPRAKEVADFLHVPLASIDLARAHAARRASRHLDLKRVVRTDVIERAIEERCEQTLTKLSQL